MMTRRISVRLPHDLIQHMDALGEELFHQTGKRYTRTSVLTALALHGIYEIHDRPDLVKALGAQPVRRCRILEKLRDRKGRKPRGRR